jgi:hypothetical protein
MLIRPSFVLRLPSNLNERKTTMETEKKPQTKKEWMKPELIVLVRNKPEEAVLAACKNSGNGSGGSPTSNNVECLTTYRCYAQCGALGAS